MADPQESQNCDRCEGPASLFCLDCNFPFCDVCFQEVHRKGRYHQRKEIGTKINAEVPSSETAVTPASNTSGSESTPSDTTPASTPDNSIIQEKRNENPNSNRNSQPLPTENVNSQPVQPIEQPAPKPAPETSSQNTDAQSQPLDKSEKRKSQWIQPARSPRVAARTFLTRQPVDSTKIAEISPSPSTSDSEYPKVTFFNADSDIGESSFFNFMQRPSSSLEDSADSQKSAEDTMENEKAKFLRLLEEERRKSEIEKKELEDQIQQEEQLRVQMSTIYAQRKEDHIKEVQGLSLENLQLKEGIDSLQAEIKRIQQEKHALQERIKTHFANMDQENKQLQKTVDELNGELGAIKKDKKTLIDKITEFSLGKVAKSPSTTHLQTSPAPTQPTQTNS